MTFAMELSQRLIGHESFPKMLGRLERSATARSIEADVDLADHELDDDELAKLHYCARVFAQTDDTAFRKIAQSIALNTLLIGGHESYVDRSISLLTDIGNFPAADYAKRAFPNLGHPKFLEALGRELTRATNSVRVGEELIALTDFQKGAWDSLPTQNSIAISAPTSAGKSFLVIEHLCRQAENADHFRAVYIAPTRALLAEVYDKINRRLGGRPDIRVSTVPTIEAEASVKQVYILTQERLQFLLAADTSPFELIVVDEAQNLSDGSRGMILQECLEQVMSRNPATRLVLLAPGAGGFHRLARAIGKDRFHEERSNLPSVLQNRIVVGKGEESGTLDLSLLMANGLSPLGTIRSKRGFDLPGSRLAAVALELGSKGGSLVYATGADNSETVASQLVAGMSEIDDPRVDELSLFIQEHIHKDYGLAAYVKRGVAFHYGKMPTLLREAIEGAFKDDLIKFLACTTTLFQGVNLPARNVFIDTPKRASGSVLDAAQLWNFAGRAGRMKDDVVGNVFLVDYEQWDVRPLDEFVGFEIAPAFEQIVVDQFDDVYRAIGGDMPRLSPRDETAPKIRAAAGLLISKAARGEVAGFVRRALPDLADAFKSTLVAASERAQDDLGLSPAVLATNWTIDPYGLRRLYDHFIDRIERGEVKDLIPPNPHDFDADKRYEMIFQTVQRYVNRTSVAAGSYHAIVADTAVKWMKGVPYPALISTEIRRANVRRTKALAQATLSGGLSRRRRASLEAPVNINAVVRRVFDRIEDEVRFQYVQLGKAYVDILRFALSESKMVSLSERIFEFPVALELGIATRSGWSFMELGLSRISAAALQAQFPDTNLNVENARKWLAGAPLEQLNLNPIILDEVKRLRLAAAA